MTAELAAGMAVFGFLLIVSCAFAAVVEWLADR